jgi:leucyl aminopeptidase
MEIVLSPEVAASAGAGLIALPFTGELSGFARTLDAELDGALRSLLETGELAAEAGSVSLIHLPGRGPARLVVVGALGDPGVDEDSVRSAAASAVRAGRSGGGTVVWAVDPELGIPLERQVVAVVEGAVLGAYDPAQWKSQVATRGVERLVIAGAPAELQPLAARTELVGRWTNHARRLVDGPPNEVTPAGLAQAARDLLAPLPVEVEVYAPGEPQIDGLPALALVGGSSANQPRLIVLRYRGAPASPRLLGLVGKGVTFDSGGYFLKTQDDIVRQKADMGGSAAVLGAVGAAAELGLPLELLAVIPAAENMLDGSAYRPSDIYTSAAGLTIEVTNTDAEGRLLLADGLWYARGQGATHLIDVATLTGAMRTGMGDMYSGVFANDERWRAALVDAGEASGDYAWPWPLHPRYRRALVSRLADLRNTAGKKFGYPIFAAAFLERFAEGTTWAHIDIHSTAFLDEQRDYLAPGASGAGVRLLTELARRFGDETA